MLSGRDLQKGSDPSIANRYGIFADEIQKKNWVVPNKRIFNNAKISDHFAIIPTLQAPKSLSEPEQKLYDMVVKRFLAVFYPAAEYLVTTRITRVAGNRSRPKAKCWSIRAGWRSMAANLRTEANLVPVQAREKVKTEDVVVKANETRPPARYSEATLLSAMEGAGKMVDDDELRAAMAGRGLGTPATRAQIIENLIGEQYIHREGRS